MNLKKVKLFLQNKILKNLMVFSKKSNKQNHSSGYYYKLLLKYSAFMGLFFLLQFAFFWQSSTRQASENYAQRIYSSVNNLADRWQSNIAGLRNLAFMVSYNDSLMNLFYLPPKTGTEKWSTVLQIKQYLSMDSVDSIVIVDSKRNQIYSSSGVFNTTENFYDQVLLSHIFESGATESFELFAHNDANGTPLLSLIYYPVRYDNNAIVIQMNYEYIYTLVDGYSDFLGGQLTICDENGSVLYGGQRYTVGAEIYAEDAFLRRNSKKPMQLSDNYLTITFFLPSISQWVIFEEDISQSNDVTFFPDSVKFIFLFNAILFITFVIVAVWWSWRLSQPMEDLRKKYEVSDWQTKSNLQKQSALSLLLTRTKEKMAYLIQSANLSIDVNRDALMLMILMDGPNNEDDIFTSRFALENVFCEILSSLCTCVVAYDRTDSVVLIMQGNIYDTELICSKIHYAQRFLEENVSVFSLTILDVPRPIENLSDSYRRMRQISESCFFDETGFFQIKAEDNFGEPLNLNNERKKLMEYIQNRNCNDAVSLTKRIFTKFASFPHDEVYLEVIKLCLNLFDCGIMLSKDGKRFDDQNSLLHEILSIRRLKVVEECFISYVEHLCDYEQSFDAEAEDENDRLGKLVVRITEIIEEEYANPMLCVQTIADRMKLSSIYLGRIYKSRAPMSVPEYILECRLNAACRLLESSDMNITQLADACGFSNASHFATVFKKNFSITPSEYRRQYVLKQRRD